MFVSSKLLKCAVNTYHAKYEQRRIPGINTVGLDLFDSGAGILRVRVDNSNKPSLPGSLFWIRGRMSICRMAFNTWTKHCYFGGKSCIAHRVTESTRTLIAALVVVAPVSADDVFVVVLVLTAGGAGVRVAVFFHCGECGRFCDLVGKDVLLPHALFY